MTVADRILHHLESLPESMQAQVLEYVEYLERRGQGAIETDEDAHWRAFSLEQAMRGMEDEPSPYTEDDIKEPAT